MLGTRTSIKKFTGLEEQRCENAAFVGTGGGDVVELEGSFDNWQSRQRMQRSGKDFTIVKLLPPGVYQVHGSLRTHC